MKFLRILPEDVILLIYHVADQFLINYAIKFKDNKKMKIIVGSKNPVKIEAVKQAFEAYFPKCEIVAIGEKVPSNVSDQPSTQIETYTGALNRAKYCKENYGADYFVGLEGGITKFFDTEEIGVIEWGVVLSKESDVIGKAGGGIFILPKVLCKLIEKHKGLESAVNELFNTTDVGKKEGVNGMLTKGIADRTSDYFHIIVQALIPFIKSWEEK